MLQHLCYGHAPHPPNAQIFFHLQFEGRKYCEHDFQMLFAPCCHQCGKFYIKVKDFALITNGNVTGGRCATLVYVLWEVALCSCAAEHLNFQNELNFGEFGELLFLKVIRQ